MIEPKNVTATSDNTGRLLNRNITCQMPFLWDVIFIFLSSIVLLTPNGQFLIFIFLSSIVLLTPNGKFLDCATIAFSEQYNEINTGH